MAAPTLDTELDLINAALIATGNSPITSLEDGSAEAAVAASNYERVLGAELAHPWTWTHTTRALNRVDGTLTTAWLYAYQVPDGVEVERIEVGGRLVAWEAMSDLILCNAEDSVTAIGRWRPPVRNWPADFKNALIIRLEALFLRALGEAYAKAKDRDNDGDLAFRMARHADAKKRSPRRPVTSLLIAARHGQNLD